MVNISTDWTQLKNSIISFSTDVDIAKLYTTCMYPDVYRMAAGRKSLMCSIR